MQNLLEYAKSEGITHFAVLLLVSRQEDILLLERDQEGDAIYDCPSSKLLESETLGQSIDRTLLECTRLKTGQIKRLLTYFDECGRRTFVFVVTVLDSEDIFLGMHKAYSWVKPEEAVGYPLEQRSRESIRILLRIT